MPCPDCQYIGLAEPNKDVEIFLCSFLEEIPICAKDICEATKVGPVLSQV